MPVATLLFKWGDTLCQYLHHLWGRETHGSRIYIECKVSWHFVPLSISLINWTDMLCQFIVYPVRWHFVPESTLLIKWGDTLCSIYIAFHVRWHFVPLSTLFIQWGDTLCQYLQCLLSKVIPCDCNYTTYQVRWHAVPVSTFLIQWGDIYYSTAGSCNRRTVLFGWDWTLLRAITITILNFITFTIKCLFPNIFIQT